MACPCCGLVGRIDTWDSNSVDFHIRKGKPEHSVTSLRRTKATTAGWSHGNAESHITADRFGHRKVISSISSRSNRKCMATIKSLQQQSLDDPSLSKIISSQGKVSAKPRARERKTLASVLDIKDVPEKVIKVSSSCKHSDILKNYVPELVGMQLSNIDELHLSPPLCREATASNIKHNDSRIPVWSRNLPDSPVDDGQNGLEDSEESEREVEGAICLSSFTFGARSQLFPLLESNASGKKALVRQLSSESCISMLSLDCTEDQLSAGCIEPLSYVDLSSEEEMSSFTVCFPEAQNYLDDEVNVSEPCFQFGDSRRLGAQLKAKHGTECGNIRPGNICSSPPVRGKGTMREKPVVHNLEKDLHSHVRSRKRIRSAISEKYRMGNRKTKRATLNFHTRRGLAGQSGGTERDSAFNLGVGIGVSYMLFANWKEFKRLNMLLERTESLVKEMEQQGCLSRLRTSAIKGPEVQKDEQEEASQGAGLKARDGTEPMLTRTNMSDLEASLEAELVLMQQNLEAELQASPRDFPEWKSNEPVCIVDDLLRKFDRTGTSPHSSINSGVPNMHYAVSPNALDKRLHEVLEAQQEERILLLEAQIEARQIELIMKERELQSWKDIAHHLIKLFCAKPVGQPEINTLIDKEIYFMADNGIKDHQEFSFVKDDARQQLCVGHLQQKCEDIKSTEPVTAALCIGEGIRDNDLSAESKLSCNYISSTLNDPSFEALTLRSTLDWPPIGDCQTQLAVSPWKEESAFLSDIANNCSNEIWADQDVCDLLKGLDVDKMFPGHLYEEECLSKFFHLGESNAVPNNSLQVGFANEDRYRTSAATT